MIKAKPIRRTYGSIPKVRLTPMQGSRITKLSELSTIAMRLSPFQAAQLIGLLASAVGSRGNQTIDITGFRKTGQVTVTRAV